MPTNPDFRSLEDRAVLITGGAGHIGRTVARAFLEAGSLVATTDVSGSDDPLADVPSDRHRHVHLDLAEPGGAATVCDATLDAFGRLDVVVGAASWMGTADTPGWNAPFAEQDTRLWPEVLQVGVTSHFELVQRAAPHLSANGHGSVILLSSIYGFCGPQPAMYEGTGINNIAGYAASKGAVTQLVRWLATTLAPDVRVNAVSPGGVFRNQQPPFEERYAARTPLGRMAVEEDLVGPILFLASDLSRYVTGHDLVVDGGFSAW